MYIGTTYSYTDLFILQDAPLLFPPPFSLFLSWPFFCTSLLLNIGGLVMKDRAYVGSNSLLNEYAFLVI